MTCTECADALVPGARLLGEKKNDAIGAHVARCACAVYETHEDAARAFGAAIGLEAFADACTMVRCGGVLLLTPREQPDFVKPRIAYHDWPFMRWVSTLLVRDLERHAVSVRNAVASLWRSEPSAAPIVALHRRRFARAYRVAMVATKARRG